MMEDKAHSTDQFQMPSLISPVFNITFLNVTPAPFNPTKFIISPLDADLLLECFHTQLISFNIVINNPFFYHLWSFSGHFYRVSGENNGVNFLSNCKTRNITVIHMSKFFQMSSNDHKRKTKYLCSVLCHVICIIFNQHFNSIIDDSRPAGTFLVFQI